MARPLAPAVAPARTRPPEEEPPPRPHVRVEIARTTSRLAEMRQRHSYTSPVAAVKVVWTRTRPHHGGSPRPRLRVRRCPMTGVRRGSPLVRQTPGVRWSRACRTHRGSMTIARLGPIQGRVTGARLARSSSSERVAPRPPRASAGRSIRSSRRPPRAPDAAGAVRQAPRPARPRPRRGAGARQAGRASIGVAGAPVGDVERALSPPG